MNVVTANPYVSPASQPQSSVMQQFPDSGVQAMPLMQPPQAPGMTPGQRAIANYRMNPNAPRLNSLWPTLPASTNSTQGADAGIGQRALAGYGMNPEAPRLASVWPGMAPTTATMPVQGQPAPSMGTNAGAMGAGRIRPPSPNSLRPGYRTR
jgi:hypothetical protein